MCLLFKHNDFSSNPSSYIKAEIGSGWPLKPQGCEEQGQKGIQGNKVPDTLL